ncbi:LTA synthase family protein [Pseudocolwellia sp. AS88]|uniref:LTA synthase family protein n=1 Tax=Pseudocolwellia sp. AS88 TaxID=3063958 RepID=UPI0026E91BE0|nr:LTA synthase family protein [Pseudocolwellia sp. AS88]MDO7083677.1 LTA synthase family protein [Pseudocolwellia sp. AS88]
MATLINEGSANVINNRSTHSISIPVKKINQLLGPLVVILHFYVYALILLSTVRLALIVWQAERTLAEDSWPQILLNGLRIDISVLSYLFIIPVLVSCIAWFFNSNNKTLSTFLHTFIKIWLITAVTTLVFFEAITPTFILEYDLRPNRLFIEYLIYPQEVCAMLFTGYKVEIISCLFILALAIKFLTKLFNAQWQSSTSLPKKYKAILALVLIFMCALGARGTLQHRPINPAMMAFSTDHLVNELTLNSLYSTLFALKQMQLEMSSADFYGDMPFDKALTQVQQASNVAPEQYLNKELPTQAFHQASYKGKPKNIVILLQESLGARYVGALGGLPLSPSLDKLMTEGWNLTNLYATGTRSVRGIEAITTGFLPTTSRSVVKLGKSQNNFFTIADFLQKQNYHTQFIYGGESHFDNMKSFFLGNGFTDIVDHPKFNKIEFEGSWGASDEDLYNQAHQEFTQLAHNDQPFFSLVFSSSNHTPYEFPDGKVALYDKDKNTRNNAAKYADYALGTFFEKAKKSDYWENTIFLVVADHDSRVAGAELVPIKNFHIPALIIGEGIEAKKDTRLTSQIDLAPTLLSLAGINGNHPMLGHDLTQEIPKNKLRALMQYDKNFAYMTNNNKVFLQPDKEALVTGKNTLSENEKKDLITRAKAHAILGSKLYQNQVYK